MATISFYAGTAGVNPLAGSGLGFFGVGFGSSVNVSQYAQTTFITDSAGVSQGPQVNNVQYLNTMSGIINSATSGVLLTQIPNALATLNVRFNHTSNVKVQNVKGYIYDRVSINNPASGVLTKAAQIIHIDPVQSMTGSGDTMWLSPGGSGVVMTLANSPGMSGIFASDGISSTRPDSQHDFYIVLSQSPSSIGSKLSALFISCEYL